MSDDLEGAVALVTGAGQGIGRAVARHLAARGVIVAVGDVSGAKVETVCAEIEAEGGTAVAARFDVSDEADVSATVAGTVERFGRLDILVNGARVEPPRPKSMSDGEWWDRVLDVDLKGAWLCSMAALAPMKARGFGRIVNITSIQAYAGNGDEDWIAYSCAKAGMIGLTRSLALAGLKHGVTANAVAPGYIETEVMAARWGAEKMQAFADSVPIGRAGRPEEIGDAVWFLVNSGFTTGDTLFITGGQFALP